MKKLTITMISLVIIVLSISQGGYVYAAENGGGFFESLISRIAAIFGLDKQKVATVANSTKKSYPTGELLISPRPTRIQGTPLPTRPSRMPSGAPSEKQTDKLVQAVKDGKITEAQKTAILAKLEEVRKANDPETMKTMTDTERKTAMDAQKAELEAWATGQGIDSKYVLPDPNMGQGNKQGNGGPPQKDM